MPTSDQTVLLIDASRTIRVTCSLFLRPTYNVLPAENLAEAEEHLKENVPGIVLVATNGPIEGHAMVDKLRRHIPDAAIGILHHEPTIEQAEQVYQHVHAVLQKPIRKEDLITTVDRLRDQHRAQRVARERKTLNEAIVHASPDPTVESSAPSRNRL